MKEAPAESNFSLPIIIYEISGLKTYDSEKKFWR